MDHHLDIIYLKYLLLLIFCVSKTKAVMCFNCSTTHRQKAPCAGDFVTPTFYFNHSRHLLVNCTGEKAMCFVRSWSARAKHAWITQRGCYKVAKDDPLPQDLTVPRRAMTCKHQRLPDAEYKVCLCQADWCNGASPSPRIVYTSLTKSRMWEWLFVCSMATLIRTYVYVFYECTSDGALEILRHS